MSATRHHFVPQGYLRGFATTDDDSSSFVWVYDKNPGRVPRKKSVRSIAWAPAYYAQEKPDGSPDLDSVETTLAQTIDNEIPQLLRRIVLRVGHSVAMTEEDKGALALFVGLSLTRVPSFRDGINAMYSKIAQIGLSYEIDKDPKLATLAENYGIRAEAKSWVSLRPMIEMAQVIAASALKKNWQFFVPPVGVPLITSDNPVIFSGGAAGLTQFGPAHPQAELVMNLRKDLALVFTPKRGYPNMQAFQLSPTDSRKFNRGIVQAARQRIFADHHSKELDSFVKKYSGSEQRIIV